MSELLAAAAAALGIPEALVSRSAQARAAETGATSDDVLAAWAGGSPMPAQSAPVPTAVEAQPSDAHDASPTEAPPLPSQPARAPAPSPAPAGEIPYTDGKPPVLVGAPDNPMKIVVASVGLFIAILLIGLVGPSLPVSIVGARSSEVAHSAAGDAGHAVYQSLGCGSCHTQLVRPVVSDVGLGAVSLNDTNQVLGTRRFGPDLSDIGSRKSGTEVQAIVEGFGGHSRFNLSNEDMSNLVTYLTESSTKVSG